MNIISVCVIAVFTVVFAAVLRKTSGETASLLVICAVVLTALLMLPYAEKAISELAGFSDKAAIKESCFKALIKSVGISCASRITADICRENGASSLAAQVELYAKLAIVLIACPLYGEMLELVSSFMGG